MALYDIRFGVSFEYNETNIKNGGYHYEKDSISNRSVKRHW